MNSVVSFEIQADDPARAVAFYEAVFGWTFVHEEHLPIEYWRLQAKDGLQGAILKRPAPTPATPAGTNAYVCSIMVADLDATAALIDDHGGEVALPKFAVPKKCWQGYFIDPDGNTFGVVEIDTSL